MQQATAESACKYLHNKLPEQLEALHELYTLGLLSSMFSLSLSKLAGLLAKHLLRGAHPQLKSSCLTQGRSCTMRNSICL